MTRICCVSDMHGNLPNVPECDILLIGGDIVPTHFHEPEFSALWMKTNLAPWLDELSERMEVVAVAGNHDFVFQHQPDIIPELSWSYLEDSGDEVKGLKIWGSPWQPRFYDWAFNLDEPELMEKWALIPEGTDILLLHGPPNGYGDFSPYGKVHTGSPSLTEKIREIKPKLAVAGHIHSGYGRYNIDDTIFVNASLVDERYKPVNKLIVVELS